MTDSNISVHKNWRQAAQVFQERAAEYDNWYEDSMLFETELAALQQITAPLPVPKLEIGAGPGRFAEQLGVTVGIDPASAALQRGQKRGIIGVVAIGEQLPLKSEATGTLFLLFTLCFLGDPDRVLVECRRVLKNDGRLVIGQIPAQSYWGQQLENKKKKGNPFYKHARFYTIEDTLTMLQQAGFALLESYSTLLGPPGSAKKPEVVQQGINEQAGFCVLVAEKKERT
ncbi:MAG: methyltransferase domain-containing protein [Deltaproteobacteria bacterium]|nr:methyltransferase domain-containing protein [Deltaproteobacteria bacterium]